MPTESKKKKSHKDEKKSLLSIKKEEEDVHPLEHYVDDRIDLIKQIFGSLKSKTIESIIPEFLQVSSTNDNQLHVAVVINSMFVNDSVVSFPINQLINVFSINRRNQSMKSRRYVWKRF